MVRCCIKDCVVGLYLVVNILVNYYVISRLFILELYFVLGWEGGLEFEIGYKFIKEILSHRRMFVNIYIVMGLYFIIYVSGIVSKDHWGDIWIALI